MLVTITGTGRSSALRDGQKMRVERTPYVDNLIRQGFAVLAGVHGDGGTRVYTAAEVRARGTAILDAINEGDIPEHESGYAPGGYVEPEPMLSDAQTAEFDAHVAKAREFADGLDGTPYTKPGTPLRPVKGSNKKTWQAYLDAIGIPYPDGATKTELMGLADG
ncbi:hypothetical protein [Tomitella gaofuii]|uniref:hypothetical protein n=1 Tax=Tomitella gaofuii TaxID=2760083 RepID=UPI0015FC34E5|nr:hypothetical protein [Tomitella gaofuii]